MVRTGDRPVWKRSRPTWRWVVALSVLVATAALGLVRTTWESTTELRTVAESLPAHAAFSAVWWNESGTRALAVGARGAVFERSNDLGEVGPARWRSIGGAVAEDLYAVGGGTGPWRGARYGLAEERHRRAFAAGARGTLLDCSGDACSVILTRTDQALRAIAVSGGQALVVGDQGTLLHVVPDPAPSMNPAADAVFVTGTSFPPISNDLRAVWMECEVTDRQRCFSVVAGDTGTIVEGFEEGLCDDGVRTSGITSRRCEWAWNPRPSPLASTIVAIWRDAAGIVASTIDGERARRRPDGTWLAETRVDGTCGELLMPVHVVETKLWWRREQTVASRVAFGRVSFAYLGTGWSPLRGSPRVVAAAAPELDRGHVALLIDAEGNLHAAH